MAIPGESSSLSPKALAAMQACRARTGFDSYHAYLDFHEETTNGLRQFCGGLRPLAESTAESLDIHRELRQEDSFVLNVSKDWQLSVDRLHCDENGTDIIEAICHRPEDAQLQIILWNTWHTDFSRSRESLVDFIGLRFGLDPHIFRAIGVLHRNLWNGGLGRYQRTHVKIGTYIGTVCHSKDDNNDKPVMLIAGTPNFLLGEQLKPCPPFDHSPSSDKQLDSTPIIGSYSLYPQALNPFLERYKTPHADPNDLLLLGFLALLQLLLLRTRMKCAYLLIELNASKRPDYTGPNRRKGQLQSSRADVRRCIVEMEDSWSDVVTYTRLHFGWNPSRSALCQDFEDSMKPIADEAKRWESAVRDHLQLEVGQASLEESKKSIEVSNQQIAESKRVKTFTILAFVYVPLNLATSIYGMNLQQLNGSGQTVRDFVVTALVALIITGGTWHVAEVVNVYRTWYRRRREDGRLRRKEQPFPVPRYSVAERTLMITWLLRDHHGPWMWRTGAFSKILFNSEQPMASIRMMGLRSAGELASAYILGQLNGSDLEAHIPDSGKSRLRARNSGDSSSSV